MADEDIPQDKIEIKINKSKGLQGSKGSQFVVVARVEFGGSLLGESPKVETNVEAEFAVIDFTCNLSVVASEPLALDELAQTPVVVTFIEILPKDKKTKEEKTNVLGQCCIDLLPLIRGGLCYTVIEQIHPVSTTIAPPETSEYVVPEVEVMISTVKPLLTDEQLNSCNLLTVCIESAFSLPEAWNQNGSQYMYAACMPVPVTAEKETMVLVPSGLYRTAGEKEMYSQRKWPCVPNASGSCLYIPNTEIHYSAYVEEDGELRNREDVEFRIEAENQKPHITWNAERRCFLNCSSTECLQQKIAQHRYWPLEVIRTIQPANVKGKGKDDGPQYSYHGIAYVDLAPLLYPGVSKIRGAYLLHPYNEVDIQEKLQRKGIITDDVVKTIIGLIRSSSSLGQSKGAPAKGNRDTKTKGSIGAIKSDGDGEMNDVCHQDSLQYAEARTYAILELELEKPLVKRRKLEAVTARVAELIPPRSPFPKKEGGSKKVIDDFEQEIGNIANILLEEFRSMFGTEFSAEDPEERKRAFLYELNTSGKYYAFKERLKYFVVKVVREKFMYTKNFDNQAELEAFISKLYIFLLDHMNFGLNKYFATEEMVEVPPPITDSNMLKHFAKEAEIMFRYDLAAKYYQERIVRYKGDVACWLDYGVFCLLIGDTQRAEECIKEVVAFDQKHMEGLLLNGLMCLLYEEYGTAEDLFDIVTYLYPDNILPWTILGYGKWSIVIRKSFPMLCNVFALLQIESPKKMEYEPSLYYSGVENNIMAERAYNEANKLLCAKKSKLEKDGQLQNGVENNIMAERAYNEANKLLCAKKSKLEKDEQLQNEGRASAVEIEQDDDELSKKVDDMHLTDTIVDTVDEDKYHSIYLHAAKFLLDVHVVQIAERALAHEHITQKQAPNVVYYKLLGQLHMQQKHYEPALEYFEKALVLKHENPEVWALKGHVYFVTGDFSAARECYERCLAYTLDASDVHAIYIRLATIYLEKDHHYEKAKNVYLTACKSAPSCVTWLGTGTSCYRLNELDDAEQALNEANILDNKNPDVWAYLTLVCLKKKRDLEAEQCYKYAVKLGISDEKLITEMNQTMLETNFDISVL